MVPLFPLQMPGAPELVVILLMIGLLALPVILLSVGVVVYFVYVRDDGSDDVVAAQGDTDEDVAETEAEPSPGDRSRE